MIKIGLLESARMYFFYQRLCKTDIQLVIIVETLTIQNKTTLSSPQLTIVNTVHAQRREVYCEPHQLLSPTM